MMSAGRLRVLPCLGWVLAFWMAAPAAAQTVTNVRVKQLADKTVEVLYDLAGAPLPGATVTLAYQAEECPAPGLTVQAAVLSGNFGAGVVTGTNRRIVWNAAATLPAGTLGSNFFVTVTAVNAATPTFTPTVTPTPTPTPTRTPTPTPTLSTTPTPTPTGPTPSPGATETFTLAGGVQLVMVKVPGGTFTMGAYASERGAESDEYPQHQQTITKDYWMGRYEVTQAQWQAVMGSAMPTTCGSFGVGVSYPVYCVSWNNVAGAGGFIEKLNTYLGLSGAARFRLPTEAEWERAARGGTGSRFSFGDALGCDDACGACATADPYLVWCGNDAGRSNPVGSKLPNQYGLYDMLGNVYEWCQDWFGPYIASPPADYAGPTAGTKRVCRLGYWSENLRHCRSADRHSLLPDFKNYANGFRLCRSAQ